MSSRRRTASAAGPQLGDLTFDDWYETPVFEAEPDERLEQLATSRRAPLRLFAGAMLRVAPDRTKPKETIQPTQRAQATRATRETGPARRTRPVGSWRDRAGGLLDRWAEMEAASQERIEALVLPKRWRG